MTKKLTTALRAPSLGMAALFTLLFTVSSAFGADLAKADVPFAFNVGAKTLPAGSYQFKIDRGGETVSVLGSKGADAVALFVTTLAAPFHSTATDAHIVFDKVGNTYTFSEIWMPGTEGILVHATKGKHEHHVLHIKL